LIPNGSRRRTLELIEDHVRFHVLDPDEKVSPKRARAADELVDIVRAYVK
jgi:hypothetical protein